MVGQIDSLLMKCSTSTANKTAIMQSKLHQYQQKDKEKENESRGTVWFNIEGKKMKHQFSYS